MEEDDHSNTSSLTTDEEIFNKYSMVEYDGINDDLVTAGFGQSDLKNQPSSATDPENPTAAEIRKATIVNQYQALLDMRESSGYGKLYGPAVSNQCATPNSNGKWDSTEQLNHFY